MTLKLSSKLDIQTKLQIHTINIKTREYQSIVNILTTPGADLGPDLQNILRQSYDYLTIMPKLRSTFDTRLIHKTSHEGRKAFLVYNSLAKS